MVFLSTYLPVGVSVVVLSCLYPPYYIASYRIAYTYSIRKDMAGLGKVERGGGAREVRGVHRAGFRAVVAYRLFINAVLFGFFLKRKRTWYW